MSLLTVCSVKWKRPCRVHAIKHHGCSLYRMDGRKTNCLYYFFVSLGVTALFRAWHHGLDKHRSLLIFIPLRHVEPLSFQGAICVVLWNFFLNESSIHACNNVQTKKKTQNRRIAKEREQEKNKPSHYSRPSQTPLLPSPHQHAIPHQISSPTLFAPLDLRRGLILHHQFEQRRDRQWWYTRHRRRLNQ